MMGNKDSLGIIPKAIQHVFKIICEVSVCETEITERASNISECYSEMSFSIKELMKETNCIWALCCSCFAKLAEM